MALFKILQEANRCNKKITKELSAVAITHNIKRVLFGNTKIGEWKEAGLIYPSLVTGIIRTIKDSMIIRKLGALSKQDFQKVQENLKKALSLHLTNS